MSNSTRSSRHDWNPLLGPLHRPEDRINAAARALHDSRGEVNGLGSWEDSQESSRAMCRECIEELDDAGFIVGGALAVPEAVPGDVDEYGTPPLPLGDPERTPSNPPKGSRHETRSERKPR